MKSKHIIRKLRKEISGNAYTARKIAKMLSYVLVPIMMISEIQRSDFRWWYIPGILFFSTIYIDCIWQYARREKLEELRKIRSERHKIEGLIPEP